MSPEGPQGAPLPPGPSGALRRKALTERRGRRAPWGRRGWKSLWAELRGALLLWGAPGGPGGAQEPPLALPHALALPQPGYSKRPNVFRLSAADGASFLCQATSAVALRHWVGAINLRAALISAPPLPPPVGSRGRFHRATLPSAPSRESPEQQLCHLRRWLQAVSLQLEEHQRLRPEGRRDSEEHREHGDFLLQQRQRCQTYVTLLEAWLRGDITGDVTGDVTGDITGGAGDDPEDDTLCDPAGDPGDCPLVSPPLAKAHSSPALAEPPPGPPGRVRRHISERRAVRSIVPKRHRRDL